MSDVRRCRRCKRKRLDDEPPEVRLYKTCAKCRIIERQKKKSRKPLAEEAMMYGMKQFDRSPHSPDFVNDDTFMGDDVFDQKDRAPDAPKPSQQQYSLYKFQAAQPQLPTQRSSVAAPSPASIDAPVGVTQRSQISHYQQPFGTTRSISTTTPIAMPVAMATRKTVAQKCNCEICGTRLDMEDELSANYKLCADCYTDPFRKPHVYADYNDYISALQHNRFGNIKNLVFVKAADRDFAAGLNLHHPKVTTERQFRETLFDNLKAIYLEPILASMSTKFGQTSSNLSEVNSLMHVQEYSQTAPLRVVFKCVKDSEFDCHSNMYVNFNVSSRLLIVKVSHHSHRISKNYPRKFVETIEDVLQQLKEQGRKGVGFNVPTAYLVLNTLLTEIDTYAPDVQGSIRLIKQHKDDYVNDFVHFDQVLKKVHSRAPRDRPASTPAVDGKAYRAQYPVDAPSDTEDRMENSLSASPADPEITDSSSDPDSSDDDDSLRPSSPADSSSRQGSTHISGATPHSAYKSYASTAPAESAGENLDPTLKP